MSLKSIKDVVDFLGTECGDCIISLGYDGEIYKSVRKVGRNAVFACDIGHEHRRKIAFQTTPEEIKSLEADIQDLLKGALPEGATICQIKDYLAESEKLMEKIRTYALFAPKNLEIQIDGYCHYCSQRVPITIKENRAWVSCSPCASMVADSVD